MICEIEVLDPSGHVSLQWDPNDPASVAKAKAEFERLRDAGFAFFASASVDADRVDEIDETSGSLDGRLERTDRVEKVVEFNPRRRRTTAVPQMRGG